ncbi:hypothetical protein V8F20_011827 [Naviculisporaceae sp. PSN 640]
MAGFKGKSSSATSRPGTKSNNNKKNPSKKSTPNPNPSPAVNSTTNPYEIPRRHQQLTLNIFRDTFANVLSSDTFSARLQTIKQALFERDFARAFPVGDADALAVYAARWSPTRALCYASVLSRIYEEGHLRGLMETETGSNDLAGSVGQLSLEPPPDGEAKPKPVLKRKTLSLLSIGGGAAEVVAFGSFLGHLYAQHSHSSSPSAIPDSNQTPAGRITLLDSAPWGTITSQLSHSLTVPPPLSKYASLSQRESNRPMIPPPSSSSSGPEHEQELFHSTFLQHDVLSLNKPELADIVNSTSGSSSSSTQRIPILVTLLFTLNELFSSPSGGILKSTTFLLNLTGTLPLGSLLLVVDSPGSYSETMVGKDKDKNSNANTSTGSTPETKTATAKKYPMHWLLDKILLGTSHEPVQVDGRAQAAVPAWKKLESQESVWFRLPEEGKGLDYPIPLENMRYQLHLYRLVNRNSLDEEEDDD